MTKVLQRVLSGGLRALSGCCVLALLLVATATSHADPLAKPTSPRAQTHLSAGNRLYRVREFAKAIEEYKAGAIQEDAPVFYYNLGQCYRQLGKYQDAIWHYERFLQRGQPTGELEAGVTGFLAQMKGELEKRAMTQAPTDPGPPDTPSNTPARVDLPSASPSSAPGTAPPPPASSGISGRKKTAIAIVLTGGVLGAVGVGLGVHAKSLKDDAAEICPEMVCDRSVEANDLIARGKDYALYANVSWGIAGAAVVAGAVLWLTDPKPETRSLAIRPILTPVLTGATAAVRF